MLHIRKHLHKAIYLHSTIQELAGISVCCTLQNKHIRSWQLLSLLTWGLQQIYPTCANISIVKGMLLLGITMDMETWNCCVEITACVTLRVSLKNWGQKIQMHTSLCAARIGSAISALSVGDANTAIAGFISAKDCHHVWQVRQAVKLISEMMANNNWIRRSETEAIPTGYLRNQKAQPLKGAIAQLPWRCGPCLQVLQLWLHIRNVWTRWGVISYSLELGTDQIACDFTFRIHNGRRAQWKSKKMRI